MFSRQNAAFNFATQHVIPQEFGGKWLTECLNPMPPAVCGIQRDAKKKDKLLHIVIECVTSVAYIELDSENGTSHLYSLNGYGHAIHKQTPLG